MSDPLPDFSLMARQLAEALNLSDWDSLSDSDLEQLLDHAEADPISETQHETILTQARQLIHQWEASKMAMNSGSVVDGSPLTEPLAASNSGSSATPGFKKTSAKRTGSGSAVVMAGVALLAVGLLVFQTTDNTKTAKMTASENNARIEYLPKEAFLPSPKPQPLVSERAVVGSAIETQTRERKRVTLPDGSILFLNENTKAIVQSSRRLLVQSGEVFVEVVPHHLIEGKTPFVVETPNRRVTALGTKFAIKANKADTDVLVTQGKVKVSGETEPLSAGQQLKHAERQPAPRASEALLWTKELMASAESPLIPKSEHAGGALVAVDPSGQEMSLSLRKQHVDVHIEDGFARTTIDQTYFNASWSRMEGTFYFPLPADASLSRLAMYVGENLMEGGMAERNHARNVFEQIRHTRRDPALLEWVDGSTFKMRVFPLEARQEKRIVISYTQRLQSAYGKVHYRFPAGHSLELIRDWSTHILVNNHGKRKWKSPSHELNSEIVEGDLVLQSAIQGVVDDRDIVLELEDQYQAEPKTDAARFSRMTHEGQNYLMLRFRPDLQGEMKRKPRNWVFLFESAGNRDSLLARVQIEVLNTLLKNAEHEDTFSLVTAATRAKVWKNQPIACTPKNVAAAVNHLGEVHLVGALNLENGVTTCQPFFKAQRERTETYLVHLGAGVAVLGEKEPERLLGKIPKGIKYVGVGVGKRWSQTFMKAAANRTGGHLTQINPDEQIGWRAFELLSLLNSPRVLQVKVAAGQHRFLQFANTLAQGEELCAITRLNGKQEFPKWVTITGQLTGKPYEKTIPVKTSTDKAGYLPRTWAKLEIDRLVAAGAEQHQDQIIKLSKAMYVMSPFTSLLVLETEAMYRQFQVDRGRKDHWALYPCPPKIPVVYEPGPQPIERTFTAEKRAKSVQELLQTVLVRTQPLTYRWGNGAQTVTQGLNARQLFGPRRVNQWGTTTQFRTELQPKFVPNFAIDDFGFSPVEEGDAIFLGNGVIPTGESVIAPHFRNYWHEETLDGISSSELFGIPTSGRSPWNMSGPVTWGRPAINGNMDFPMDLKLTRETIPSGTEFLWEDELNVRGLSSIANHRQFWNVQNRIVLDYDFPPQDETFDPVEFSEMDFRRQNQSGQTFFERRSQRFSNLGRWGYTNGATIYYPKSYSASAWPFLGYRPESNLESGQSVNGFLELPALEDWPRNGTVVGLGAPEQFGLKYSDFAGTPRLTNSNWTTARFGDLPAHAPGLNTRSVDVLSLLETQGPTKLQPKRGRIDPKAQAVIDLARGRGWEAVTLPHPQGQPGLTIHCDGQGRHTYERTLSEGLREQVVCDGETLLHLYRELGLGGRRSMSRFHRAELQHLVPWFIPPAEDLAVGCNIVSVNDHTIALVPLASETDNKKQSPAKVYLLMVFRADGSLQERQWVETKTNKPLLIVNYDASGEVSVYNPERKRIGHAAWKRKPAGAPQLKADLTDLVVLSLPHRNPQSFLSSEEQKLANSSQFLALDEDKALALLGSYQATGNASWLTSLLQQRYFAKEDHRLGLYVLLASTYQQVGLGNPAMPLTQKHPNSPLAEYVWQHFQWSNTGNANQDFVVTGSPDGFVQRLTRARNLSLRWKSGRAVKNRSATEIQLERKRGLQLISELRSPQLGWMLLTTMQAADTDSKGLHDYIQAAEDFAQRRGFSMAARYQAAHWKTANGQTAEAIQELETLSQEFLDAGMLPPITEHIRNGFRDHAGLKAWETYLSELQSQFLKEDQRHAALLVAMRAGQIKKDHLSERLLAKALQDLVPEQHPMTTLFATRYFIGQKQYSQAERFLAPLLKLAVWSKEPRLWRKAAEIAGHQNQEALSVARMERALLLEYETLPDLINLQNIRNDYGGLLNRLESLASQSSPEVDLKQRAIRLADRWRVLDPDDTPTCQTAARIMSLLGDQELAWDYLTTPLADKPNESAPWLALAKELSSQQKIDLAERAYRQAFDAEATNPQILWDHAELLKRHDRDETAQELLEKIANEKWQPRFNELKAQAQQRLKTGNSVKGDLPKPKDPPK